LSSKTGILPGSVVSFPFNAAICTMILSVKWNSTFFMPIRTVAFAAGGAAGAEACPAPALRIA
jgi:hypothetical protein